MRFSSSFWHNVLRSACVTCALVAWQPVMAQNAPPPMPIPPTTAPAASSVAQGDDTEAVAEEERVSLNWQGSLMFQQKDVDDLVTIYRAYLESLSRQSGEEASSEEADVAKLTLERLAGIQEPTDVDEEIYNFALNSILYNHARDWSIWVNGKGYSRKQALEGFTIGTSAIKVTNVQKGQITYVWEPKDRSFDAVQQRLNEKQQRQAAKVQNPQIAANEQVSLDGINQKVTVTLRPNQTFMSQYMSVMEGTTSHKRAAAKKEPGVNAESREETIANPPVNMPGETMMEPVEPMHDDMTTNDMADGMDEGMDGNYVDPNEVPVYENGMEPGM